MRARDLGIAIGGGAPGATNAITDVPGVRVGHATIIDGEGPLVVGRGPVRTGVTVVVPHDRVGAAVVTAGAHRLNGNGEMTGLEWVRESGMLTSPIAITNTHSVGVVRDSLIAHQVRARQERGVWWSLPVVGETWDGVLNDVNGQHVRPEHVDLALDTASTGPVAEGNVGGGTGMICHGFKGGIGTASRVVTGPAGSFIVGVLVQANHGRRPRLSVNGAPVGHLIGPLQVPLPGGPSEPPGAGSIIGVVGTDAPLLPHQCERLAQRMALGVGRVGGAGEHSSGDLFIAFSTGNAEASAAEGSTSIIPMRMLSDDHVTDLYYATIESTEEAILNALVAAETMRGRDGNIARAIPHDLLSEAVRTFSGPPTG